MDTNDLNRRIRYALSLDDENVALLYELVDFRATREQITGWRQKSADEGFQVCPPEAIDALLNGLIRDRRGEPEKAARTGSPDTHSSQSQIHSLEQGARVPMKFVDNNMVLKQLRIALTLKTDDVLANIRQGGGKLGKSEVNALFRNSSARNYRQCGDQVLRWFLNGLASSLRS